MTEKQQYIDQVKIKYKQIRNKGEFITKVAADLDLDVIYVRNHYFSNYWNGSKKNENRVIELLDQEIELQS